MTPRSLSSYRRLAPMRWQERMAKGETIDLRAGRSGPAPPANISSRRRAIPGARSERATRSSTAATSIIPSPGANDNASGCAGDPGDRADAEQAHRREAPAAAAAHHPLHLAVPRWKGRCLAQRAAPKSRAATPAAIHLDMVGGDTEKTKSICGSKARRRACRASSATSASPSPVGQRSVDGISPTLAKPHGRSSIPRATSGRSGQVGGFRRERPPGVGRGQLARAGDLHRRLARPLHPYPARRPRQSRRHQAEARDVHRRRLAAGTWPMSTPAMSPASRWR